MKLLATNILFNKFLPLEYKALKSFYGSVTKKAEPPAPLEKHTSDGSQESKFDIIAKTITGMTGLYVVANFLVPNSKEWSTLKTDASAVLVTFGIAYDLFMTCKNLIQPDDDTHVPVGGEGGCCAGHN